LRPLHDFAGASSAARAQCPRGSILKFDGVGKIADADGASTIVMGGDFAHPTTLANALPAARAVKQDIDYAME
jgi:hypothetical protein